MTGFPIYLKRRMIMATDEIKSIYELIERGSELFKDKNLFKFNKEDEVAEISYNEFLDYVNKITFAFINMGVKDKKVVVIGETSVEWIASYIATVTAGGVIVPLDPYLLEDEIIKFVNHSEASFVVCSPAFEKLFRDREKDIPAVYEILKKGTAAAKEVAAETLADVKRSMKINYFEDAALIAEQSAQFAQE